MNNINNQSYIKYFLLAVGLHCLVLAVITFNHSSQETLKVSAEPKTTVSKEIAAALVQPDVAKKVKVAELQKLVEKQEQEKPEIDDEAIQLEKQEKLEKQQKIKAAKLAAEKLAVEKLAKEQLEKSKAEQLVKLEKEKREQEKIQAAQLLEEKKRLLEQKRIAQAQQDAREAAQKRIIQAQKAQQVQQELAAQQAAAAAQQELALQAQRANEQAQLLRIIDRYALLMRAKIHQNWRRPVGIDNLYKCKVAVRLGSHGEVISASVIDSSGNIEFDRSAELAIRKSSPLPLPSDEKMRAPFNNFTFTFDPQMA